MFDKTTTANTFITSETTSTESINSYIRVVAPEEDIPINQNKPWRIVIRRQVTDGGNYNENYS